jgi:tripeptide aminopeptidase
MVPPPAVAAPSTGILVSLSRAREIINARNVQTLAWQAAVTRIGAPTGAEGARGAWMADQFRAIGWDDITVDAVGNVLARRAGPPSPGGEVWCVAHLDTVFADVGPVEVTAEDGRLRGPGICDNGRGLAALLAIADALVAAEVETARDVVMIATVGEEGLGDLRGMQHALTSAATPPAAVIAIDGSGDDRIVHCALGASRWRITIEGPGGHSWADHGTVNPVAAAATMAHHLTAMPLPREPRTTLTVTGIGGGESINSIPRAAWVDVDLRSLGRDALRDAERGLHQVVREAERREHGRRALGTPTLTVRVTEIGRRPTGMIPSAAPLVQLAQRVTASHGLTPKLASGSTDASVAIARGIPAIAIGAGGLGGGMHTRDEWYDDRDGVRGVIRALEIIAQA